VHRDIAYAYYLRALCYYEQIADIERDQKGTEQAMNALREVVNRFPDTSYAVDAKLKIDLCFDHLAGKEMEIGRFYQKQHLYEAAIGRFQRVVDDFQTTNHVPEALARLTEIYLVLGLKDQARKTAAVLGYNYPGSEWYTDSYAQLVDDGVTRSDGKPANADESEQRGFFSRAWHAVF
jgi:outer membrane protein assembly factor BamD